MAWIDSVRGISKDALNSLSLKLASACFGKLWRCLGRTVISASATGDRHRLQ